MAGLSTYGEALVLNALLTGCYVSAHTGDPGNTGASEVAGGSYARVALGAYSIATGNPSIADNDAIVEHPTSTADWGTITHFGLWTALSGGNFIGGKALDASKVILTAYVLRYPAGSIQISTDDV
jgi:hypothetical protein